MLPEKFNFLNEIGPLPKLVSAGLQYLGIKEYPGQANNPVIMQMAKELKVDGIYTGDSVSWCALFINYLLLITGKPAVPLNGDLYNILRAKWLLNWGEEIPIDEAVLGDLIILNREGGGHVTIYIAEAINTVFGLGGNQSNSVSISEFKKERIIGVRRFYAIAPPASARKYYLTSSGKFSINEA